MDDLLLPAKMTLPEWSAAIVSQGGCDDVAYHIVDGAARHRFLVIQATAAATIISLTIVNSHRLVLLHGFLAAAAGSVASRAAAAAAVAAVRPRFAVHAFVTPHVRVVHVSIHSFTRLSEGLRPQLRYTRDPYAVARRQWW